MFSADLSWTDPDTEKVGERRERKARERSSSSATPSLKSSKSSKSSISVDRELWWPSSLKKAKSVKPSKRLRPDTSRGIDHARKQSGSMPHSLDLEPPVRMKDPSLQPGWTYSSSLSSTLPSGASLDLPEYEVPELEGDLATRRRNSNASRHSSEGSYSVKIEGCLDFDQLKVKEESEETSPPPAEEKPSSYASGLPQLAAWRPPSNWEVFLPSEPSQDKTLPPLPVETAVGYSSTLGLTRFQRFIRRMEHAGPKVILDRLKEEWHDSGDEEGDEELKLEKQLWILTAFQLQNLGRSKAVPKPSSSTGKILELYGNLCNASYLTVPQAAIVPLPYSDSSFSHIRASTLPSLVPSSKLPQLFRECYRLLATGGMLEIRVMDASPIRKTAGPKMRAWIEDRLSLNLERLFRCSKPCMLVPTWITDAGFDLPTSHPSAVGQTMKIPCAVAKENSNVDDELSTLIGKELWKDNWGRFIDEVPGQARWWWEDEGVIQECRECRTAFECGTLFAFKR
ncbi:hypothetical protein K469DRAFT_645200 [Zopfia rhizophila CBS 207.26]|uniref:Methyltransferase type 11 domain-containing protein n=1 Tax=Zopfia rhizophila CBS 207.26 TaxID=1314779 RepID=A0A6A6DBB6_9PEZI|nr:hypothetical protein K469DRAFT_645200 [Zopfia rhizophila CBS 207.26]